MCSRVRGSIAENSTTFTTNGFNYLTFKKLRVVKCVVICLLKYYNNYK